MKLAEILTGPDVWAKYAYYVEGDRMCVLGALAKLHGVAPGHVIGSAEYERFQRVVSQDGKWFSVMRWNDTPERTWEDVAAAIEAYDRDRMLNP